MAQIDRNTSAPGAPSMVGAVTPPPVESFLQQQINRMHGVSERLFDVNRELNDMLTVHKVDLDKKTNEVALSEPVGPLGVMEQHLDQYNERINEALEMITALKRVVG